MEIEFDPIEGAVITPPLDPKSGNVGADIADIAERMQADGMAPQEILLRLSEVPPFDIPA